LFRKERRGGKEELSEREGTQTFPSNFANLKVCSVQGGVREQEGGVGERKGGAERE